MSRDTQFDGVWTAIVTPFDTQGDIDWQAFDVLIDMQVKAKVTGLVLCGTTGEAPTLSVQEKLSIVRRVKANYGQHIKIMAGTGGNNTAQSIEISRLAADSGADALLIVTPPYNKPSLAGLKAHYKAIADAQDKPLCLYHVPGRTAQLLSESAIAELCAIKNVLIVKEASGDVALFSRALNKSQSTFLTGDDPTFLASMSVGGHGVISVFSNVFPEAAVAMYDAYKVGDHGKALKLHQALLPFIDAMFVETNPCPVKACLAHMGLLKNHFRLPLVAVSGESMKHIIDCYQNTKASLDSILS